MKRALLRLAPWLLGAALMAVIVRTVPFDEAVGALRRLRPWEVAVLIAANGLVLFTITGRWWFLLRGQGHRVPFPTLFGYRLAVFGLSYFTPGPHVGGEPLQVLLVERAHGVPRRAALVAVALDKAIEFSINFTFLALGIAAILRWRIVPAGAGWQALGLAAALLALPLLYLAATALGRSPAARLVWRIARLRPLGRWSSRLADIARALEEVEAEIGKFYRRAPGPFAAAICMTLLSWVAIIGEYWLMAHFLGVNLALPQLVTALTAARIAILLLLPAGLGALEASQAAAFSLLGLNPAVGISVSLLIRARDTLLAAVGLWWGTRRLAAGRTADDATPATERRPPEEAPRSRSQGADEEPGSTATRDQRQTTHYN